MRSMRAVGAAGLLVLLLQAACTSQNRFHLHNGDRVVFYGDSITDQRLYTTFVETYVVTRFPTMVVSFVHSGWGGDRVTGGGGGPIDLRLDRDVIAYRPTVMTIMLGMNDASYRPLDESIFNTYKTGYAHILEKLKTALPNLRLTLIEPSPFDDVTYEPRFPGGYNAVLVKYSEYVKDLAQRSSCGVADMNGPVVAALERAKGEDPKLAQKIIPDRVHPGPGGHLLMAEALLKAWNAPALVSSAEIEVDNSRVKRSAFRYAKATWSEAAGSTLAWTQTDDALPMPMDMNDAPLALSVRSSDFVEALNQQPLKVTGLAASRYRLAIDGEETGIFTREQLAQGINLATLSTPMTKQAKEVHTLTLKHNNIHFIRWRNVQVPLQNEPPDLLAKALRGLDDLEADVIHKQRAAAQPKPHHFELAPAS